MSRSLWEIRLWCATDTSSPNEEKLVNSFSRNCISAPIIIFPYFSGPRSRVNAVHIVRVFVVVTSILQNTTYSESAPAPAGMPQ